MKDHSPNYKSGKNRAAANEIGDATSKSAPTYQINDRRPVSVMQRKLRNLANGLASANIIQNQSKSEPKGFQSKVKPIIQDPKNSK